MHATEFEHRLAAGKSAVLAQTELLHREFGRAASQWKSDGTRVTAVDLAISEGIFRDLARAFPDDGFFSEETTDSGAPLPVGRAFAWVLDPIDGTNNYAAGIAHCAISLALLHDGWPVYGFLYDLSRRTLLHGGPGRGLWDGERAARVKSESPNPHSLIGFHSPFDKRLASAVRPLVENFKIRGLGSSALHLGYVAAGLLDGSVDHNVKVWDIAASYALCQGGGAEVHFLNGDVFPLRQFDLKMPRIHYLAGNAALCTRLRDVLGA